MRHRRATPIIIIAVTAVLVAACSGSTTLMAEAADDRTEQPRLDAVIEPATALVADFGTGWTKVDEWYTEGAATEWDSGCQSFDDLDAFFNSDTPTTTIWTADHGDLVHRTASLDWAAADYVELVATAPGRCEAILGGQVSISDVDLIFADVTAGDGRLAAIQLSAYPIADPATDTVLPEFRTDRMAWMVVASRHNVVSQLIYSPAAQDTGPDGGAAQLAELVGVMQVSLAEAPIEARGPIVKPAPAPTVEFRVVERVALRFDPDTCRNDGGFELDGIDWRLSEPVPYDWRDLGSVDGDVTMEGTSATFVGPDGTTLALSSSAVETSCHDWEREPRSKPSQAIGRLDCGPGSMTELRVPDGGQTPERLAIEAEASVVRVEAGDPLQWWGLDQAGKVVVGVLLGDAGGADYQIFTCTGRG